MLIRNARIVLENEVIHGSLRTNGSFIATVSRSEIPPLEGEEVIDTEDCYVLPGFVDLHTHGSGNFDFMDGEITDITCAARSLAIHGTTTCLPTLLTSSDDDLFLF
jgi:N-acetylglucosamine-6-phosphate deacetylase